MPQKPVPPARQPAKAGTSPVPFADEPFKGPEDPAKTPAALAVQAQMQAKGVETQSQLHELHGKTVVFGDYTDVHPLTKAETVIPGGPGVIDYVVGGRFRATMEGGRQPWGAVAGLKDVKGQLTYSFPVGA